MTRRSATRSRAFRVSRVYDDHLPDDPSYRVLVDRLWPRGVTKAEADLDGWLQDVAPSAELRRWYDHDVEKFAEFARRYRAELRRPPASSGVERLVQRASSQPVTLLTSTRDVEHSGAVVLHDHLTSQSAADRQTRGKQRRTQ